MIDKYTYTGKEIKKMELKERIFKFLYGNDNNEMLNFEGKYQTWEEAQTSISSSYSSDSIFDKVKTAALSVRDGKAAFERDGYLFYEKESNFPILAILLSIFVEMGEIRVLDFGGSLGSMYFQHKDILSQLGNKISWTVVEQEHFVEFGKKELENEILKFAYKIEEVEKCNCVIFGSSLQYIENYKDYIEKALKRKEIRYVIIDKTPVSSTSWIGVEHVHEPIYEASYPFRVFDKNEFLKLIEQFGYEICETWQPEFGTEF